MPRQEADVGTIDRMVDRDGRPAGRRLQMQGSFATPSVGVVHATHVLLSSLRQETEPVEPQTTLPYTVVEPSRAPLEVRPTPPLSDKVRRAA